MVSGVHRPDRGADGIPALLVVERPPYGFGDEPAPAACPHPLIQTPHKIVVQGYVHAHGHYVTHWVDGQRHKGGTGGSSPSKGTTPRRNVSVAPAKAGDDEW